jgi:hypothetical protein
VPSNLLNLSLLQGHRSEILIGKVTTLPYR